MFWAITFLFAGIIIGKLGRKVFELLPLSKIVFFAILILLAIMGAQIGADQQIMSNLPALGLKALFLTLGALAGTIIFASLGCKIYKSLRAKTGHSSSISYK